MQVYAGVCECVRAQVCVRVCMCTSLCAYVYVHKCVCVLFNTFLQRYQCQRQAEQSKASLDPDTHADLTHVTKRQRGGTSNQVGFFAPKALAHVH